MSGEDPFIIKHNEAYARDREQMVVKLHKKLEVIRKLCEDIPKTEDGHERRAKSIMLRGRIIDVLNQSSTSTVRNQE